MAHSAAHHSITAISRSDNRSAVAAAAYRHGIKATDERTGTAHDYRRKQHVDAQGVVGWSGDVASLWNAAEAAENRKNSRTARETTIALPHELTPAEQEKMARLHCLWLRKEFGVASSWAIHRKPGNHHLHIMETTRRVQGDVFGEKARELDDGKTGPINIEKKRAHWAEIANRRLTIHGVQEQDQVDHRSHARRAEADAGPAQEPEQHFGPARWNVAKKIQRETREAKKKGQTLPAVPVFIVKAADRRKRNKEAKALWLEWKRTQKELAAAMAAQSAKVSLVETGTGTGAGMASANIPEPSEKDKAIARTVAFFVDQKNGGRSAPPSRPARPPPGPALKPKRERGPRQHTR